MNRYVCICDGGGGAMTIRNKQPNKRNTTEPRPRYIENIYISNVYIYSLVTDILLLGSGLILGNALP